MVMEGHLIFLGGYDLCVITFYTVFELIIGLTTHNEMHFRSIENIKSQVWEKNMLIWMELQLFHALFKLIDLFEKLG